MKKIFFCASFFFLTVNLFFCQDTPLRGPFNQPSNGVIDVLFDYPNSYYAPNGYTKIISPIIISLDGKKIIIQLNDLCPLKTLRDRSRGDPKFYGMRELILPIGTAEEVMNNYAYAKLNYNIA